MPKGLLVKFEDEKERTDYIMEAVERLCNLYSSNTSCLEEIRFDEDTFHVHHSDVCIVGTKYGNDTFYTIGYKFMDQIIDSMFGSYDLNTIICILEYRYARYKTLSRKDIDWKTYIITEAKIIRDEINQRTAYKYDMDDLNEISIGINKWKSLKDL